MRKATAFRGGANKTAPPCETLAIICYLATVPVEQLQQGYLTENPALRENGLQRPSLPRESQLPLKPCISLQPSDFEGNCDSLRFSPRFLLHFIVQFDLLRKCGLLAHTSAAFLKNCCTEKLLFACSLS